MNKSILIGRLTKDPELRYNDKNKAITSFTVAVHRPYKNENGEYDADFILCKSFGARAETIGKFCRKGDLVGIEGSIRTGSYEKDGQKMYSTEIMVENVHFLTPNTNTPTNDKTSQNKAKNNVKQETSEEIYADFGDSIEISDEDIAF